MKALFRFFIYSLLLLGLSFRPSAQSMHFSQFYNAPLLLNPANVALTPESDYRFGVQHRSQWVAIPVPYTTTSMFGDFQAFRNQNESNWLGVGFAFFNDNVGDGKLRLFRSDLALSYHVQLGEIHMLSFGASVSNGQRSINFSKFSYPVQWDGYTFNRNEPNQEGKGLEKSNYNSVASGINYAFMPNDAFYIKVGWATANLNKPVETFFTGASNRLQYRHTANLDILIKTAANVIVNPSAYYSTQSGAKEILYGSLFLFNMVKPDEQIGPNQLIFGAYNRWGDAVVGVAGIQRNGFKFTASYDYTISTLPINAGKGTGAFELSILYEGLYGESSKARGIYHCPRF